MSHSRRKKGYSAAWLPAGGVSPAFYDPAAGDTISLNGFAFGNVAKIDGVITLPADYNALVYGPITIDTEGSLTIPEGTVFRIDDIDSPNDHTHDHSHDPTTTVSNFNSTTFENQLSDAETKTGDILKYEPGGDTTLTAGRLYFLHTDGTWDEADADSATTSKQLLGVALGTSAKTDGMLTRGFVKIPSTEVLNLPSAGATDGLPVYVSTTAGHFDFTAPSATGDIVRVVGYCIDDDSSDILLLFRPDNTWVEIA